MKMNEEIKKDKTTNKKDINSKNEKTIQGKLQKIQSKIGSLFRTETNKGQGGYKYFDEQQALKKIKPLLDEYRLVLFISDDTSKDLIHEREGNLHFVRYLKRFEIQDIEALEKNLNEMIGENESTVPALVPEGLVFSFWAMGQNTDIAKAKGSAETYAVKCILSKFFLIEIKDMDDPDYQDEIDKERKEEQAKKETLKDSSPKTPKKIITSTQVDVLYNLYDKKRDIWGRGIDSGQQVKFLTKFDEVIKKNNSNLDKTNDTNLKTRIALLFEEDYKELGSFLQKL